MANTTVSRANLNRVQYAGLDFDSYEDEILARLQITYAASYNDFVVSSLGIMLVDLFAFGLDTLAFYLDRRATDNFLSTARTRKSVARAARQIGYKMGPAVASSVLVAVSLQQQYPFDVPLPIGFEFKGPNGLIFEAQQAYTWPKFTNSTASITCSEGQTLSATFTSNGLANQIFPIANVPVGKFVVGPGSNGQSQVTVTVNGVKWTESELLSFGATNQFEIGYNDSPPTLRFGDGVAGNIPPQNASVVITYFASTGINGQVLANTIQSVNTPLVVNTQNIGLVINNPSSSVGGSDAESIASAKANAPLFFKSRGVNITAEDYQSRAGTFRDGTQGAIAVAHAITVKSAGDDAYLNSQLNSISSDTETLERNIDNTAASLLAGPLANIKTDINDPSTGITALLGLLNTDLTAIAGSTSTIKTAISQIQVGQGQINTAATALQTAIAGIPTAVSDGLTAATRATLTAQVTVVQTGAAAVDPSTIATQNGSIVSKAAEATGFSGSISAKATDVLTQEAAAETQVNNLTASVGTLVADIGSIQLGSGFVKNIFDHVNAFLSADCSANLVEVPVLTLDADGFYVPPTFGLMKSLQSFLDQNKEVSQVVKVVGAYDQLVQVWLSVKIGILTGFVIDTVKAQVQAAVLNVMKGRSFGATLYLDELYGPVTPSTATIDGLSSVNISIVPGDPVAKIGTGVYDARGILITPALVTSGSALQIDEVGNLQVDASQVATRGTDIGQNLAFNIVTFVVS
jgi:hypothetical protein